MLWKLRKEFSLKRECFIGWGEKEVLHFEYSWDSSGTGKKDERTSELDGFWKGTKDEIEPGILRKKAQSSVEILMCLQKVEFNLVFCENNWVYLSQWNSICSRW